MFTDGALLRELRTAAGIPLRTMAARTNFTPGYLSLVETGRKPVTAAVVGAYRKILGDPALDPKHTEATPGRDDITVILERTRHLEDVVGTESVVPMVRGLDGLARRIGGDLAAEVATYRGWLEFDTGRLHVANKSFEDAARLADDPSQRAHALSFRAFTAQRQGDTARALDLTDASLGERAAHPILGVYARHQRAEILAMRGERRKAGKTLADAETAAVDTDGIDLPAYGYWYTAGFWSVHRGVVLSLMGRRADAVREAEAGMETMPIEHRSAGWIATLVREVDPEMTA